MDWICKHNYESVGDVFKANLLIGLDVKGLVDLLELGGGGSAEDANKTGEEVSGLWHVVLDLLDLLGDGFDQLHLLLKWELLEWREL